MADPFEFERPERYAVLGNPVAHSKSPQIHALFAHQFKHRIEYSAIQVDPGGFRQAVEQFRAAGGKGIDIAPPFAPDAFRFADHMSERARLAGAVNTLKLESDGRAFGDNTDGAGLVRDVEINLDTPLRGKQVCLLGAGAAARSVLAPLLRQNPARVVVAHSTAPKAREAASLGLLALAGALAGLGVLYYAGLAVAASAALYQQWLIRDRAPAACLKAFVNNNWFGLAVFAGLALSYLVERKL